MPGDTVQQSQHRPWTNYIPGILGGACLGFGGYALIANRDHAGDLPFHPIK
ncbi:MAG TPA: hypothetical protein VKD70_17510 [Candidatus Acidoferrum sp.]|nr:hypothetical protein [Candidatus Acidoferrum sp.]